MGLDKLSTVTITLKRCNQALVITSLKKDEDAHEIESFRLSSFFKLLEGEEQNPHPNLHNITSLDLSYCEISELPKSLKCLHLQDLNLSHNQLTTVPQCLYGSGLDALQSLDLSHNFITCFVVEPDCVSNLKTLRLNNNCFGNIPAWFLAFRCINLEELDYSENKAEHYNFLKHSCNFSLVKLKKLHLKNSCLIDVDLSWLKNFRNLQFLDISNKSLSTNRKFINKFKDIEQLFSKPLWREMKILKLCYLGISFFPAGMFCIESLTELHISHNFLSWFPDGIEYLVNLEFLDVSCNELIVIPKEICHLENLKVLIACENHLDEILSMPINLEVLDLYDNYIKTIEGTHFNSIMYIDLDFNYLCFEDHQDFSYDEYCLKRDQFRTLYNIKDRCSENKLPENVDESLDDGLSSSNSSENDYSDYQCNKGDILPSYDCDEEDWDKECQSNRLYKNPDITLSDDEYNGESPTCFNNVNPQGCTYPDDEDWIFTDAD